jgi:uncharacterized membrane protein
MRDLGVLSGGSGARAYSLNEDGSEVVGQADMPLGTRGFVWTPGGGMIDLNVYLASRGLDLTGWVLTSAIGISPDGSAITGDGYFNGQQRGWLVTGVPSPGLWAPLASFWLISRRSRSH